MSDTKSASWLPRAHVRIVVTFIPLLVRLLPLKCVLRLAKPPRWLRPYRRLPAGAITAVVDKALARPINMRRRACLRKGLTLYHFLLLAGHAATIHFAVYPAPHAGAGRMLAHCWVRLDGRDVSEPPGPEATVILEP